MVFHWKRLTFALRHSCATMHALRAFILSLLASLCKVQCTLFKALPLLTRHPMAIGVVREVQQYQCSNGMYRTDAFYNVAFKFARRLSQAQQGVYHVQNKRINKAIEHVKAKRPTTPSPDQVSYEKHLPSSSHSPVITPNR